jgi:hypothetical protein
MSSSPLIHVSSKGAPMTATKPPSKRWRITTADGTSSYTSERKLYDVLNDQVNRVASIGAKVDIHHLEGGRWVLYERAVITENGWEPA